MFWAQLVNYDVNLRAQNDEPESYGRNVVHWLENVRVIIPLPEGVRAKSVRVCRPEGEDVSLAPEHGLEGCAVTLPRLDIYALVAVTPEKGGRPATSLREVKTLGETVQMAAKSLERVAEPCDKILVRPPCKLPETDGAGTARTFKRPVLAYVSVGAGKALRLGSGGGEVSYRVYGMDGREAAAGSVGDGLRVDVPVPSAGSYAVTLGTGSVSFLHDGGASFEASRERPCTLDEKGDSPPLYFYVPKGCDSFVLKCASGPLIGASAGRGATERKVSSLYALRLLVRDPEGSVVLEYDKPIDDLVPFTIEVPAEQAGKVWSLVFADQEPYKAALPAVEKAELPALGAEPRQGTGELLDDLDLVPDKPPAFDLDEARRYAGCRPKSYVHFYLQGVPPVVANTPAQLLIAKGDE
jgi:hypothetical protein